MRIKPIVIPALSFVLSFLLFYLTIYIPSQKVYKSKLDVEFSKDMKLESFLIDAAIQKAIEGARSMSSRTMIRNKIVDYNNGVINFLELKEYSTPKYIDGVKALDDCVYAARYVNNQLLVEHNNASFQPDIDFISDTSIHEISTKISNNDSLLIIGVISPIRHKSNIIGFDILYSESNKALKNILSNNIGFKHILMTDRDAQENTKNSIVHRNDSVVFYSPSAAANNVVFELAVQKNQLYTELKKFNQRALVIIILLSSFVVFLLIMVQQNDRLRYYREGKFLEELVNERTIELKEAISELETINYQLNEKEEQLLESNQTKDKFFSILAHDLSGPFNALINLFSIIRKKDIDTEKRERLMQEMQNSLESTSKLLDNLLTWSRSQRGKLAFYAEIHVLEYVADGVVKSMSQQAENKSIGLINSIDKTISVKADINMLKTILRNLISNAIKFTPEHGEITIGARHNDSLVEIWVKDSGLGIAPELMDKLFKIQETFSTRGTNNESGSGLGLILCKEFVDRHGGQIWVESQEGKGSTFIFTLPAHN